MIKNLPAKQERWVQSLGREDPVEEGMATHSNILAWRIPWTEESEAIVYRVAKSWTRLKQLSMHTLSTVPKVFISSVGVKIINLRGRD